MAACLGSSAPRPPPPICDMEILTGPACQVPPSCLRNLEAWPKGSVRTSSVDLFSQKPFPSFSFSFKTFRISSPIRHCVPSVPSPRSFLWGP